MDDTREMLQQARERFAPPIDVMDSLIRRRERKQRNRKVFAGAVAILIAFVSFAALARAILNAERPANEPSPTPPGIFSEVGGWIVYGPLSERCEPTPCENPKGIRAVDPTGRTSQIQLTTDGGTPLAWSSDGSMLLIMRVNPERARGHAYFGSNLFMLNADGTETRLTEGHDWLTGGSFSPDGSKVVYASTFGPPPNGIFVVDAAGGAPVVLLAGGDLSAPTFSPDGSKIAYFAPKGSNTYRLRVMNADGSGSRDLSPDTLDYAGDTLGLVWSPDGTRLAIDLGGNIYTIGADGSDLTQEVPHAGSPNWSPDGSRIAYDFEDVSYPPGPWLEIADADGKNTLYFRNARSGPWNPLVQPDQQVADVTATSGGATFDTRLVWGAVVLALGGTFVVMQRRRRFATEP